MTTTSIIDLTIQQAITVLNNALITEVDDDDQKPFLVRAGRLYDDPTQDTGISVLIYAGHPEDTDYQHGIYKNEFGVSAYPHEIGGGVLYWRRYTATLAIYDLDETNRTTSLNTANVVLGRLEHTLRFGGIYPSGVDSFGESCSGLVLVTESGFTEGGAGFIWRGEVRFQTLNEIGAS